MNEFFDTSKRSITLPAGCKDLIEVLQPRKRLPLARQNISLVQGGLADVAKHLANLLGQGAKTKHLGITWQAPNYVHLVSEGLLITALLAVQDDPDREHAIRAVFAAANLAPIRDESMGPWSWRVLEYPLLTAPSKIEALVSDLLRNGYGLGENVRLEFLFWEDEAA